MHGKVRALSLASLLLLLATSGRATPPPRDGGKLPEAYLERIRKDPKAFTFTRSLLGQAQRIQRNRARAAIGALAADDIQAAGGIVVQGERFIPVIPVKFRNTAQDPYPVANLQKELFDGPFPTGTMTDYYREVSYGLLTVKGTVRPWKTLAHDDTFYEGADFTGENGSLEHCNGMCAGAGTGDLLKEALDATDPDVDFSQFDNDGPDGIPNSGDDDGFVDFVAFVHPETGGECSNAVSERNIWSHRWIYSEWKGAPFITKDKRKGGGFIRVNDYVITPALACDNSTMIQIGVFAHEFGHAFGLPDLYDTDRSDGDSEGVGNWCLMGAGSWGGDNEHPERPAHLSAWAKSFLGWIFPHVVSTDEEFNPAEIPASETTRLAYKIPISQNQFYLIENRQRQGFDDKIRGSGLLIWKINNSVVTAGLTTNRVNADATNKGVELEQADGRNDLDALVNRADGGDVFPGSSDNRQFDTSSSSNPRSIGPAAVCEISDSGLVMKAVLLTTGTCPGSPQAASTGAAPVTSSNPTDKPAGPAKALSIRELASTPEKYVNQPLQVTGTLVNLGKNYFTDRRIVLRDTEGHTFPVQPWLPLEVPRKDHSGPPTLANYLDKKIVITGTLERKAANGEALVLSVTSVEVVPPQ